MNFVYNKLSTAPRHSVMAGTNKISEDLRRRVADAHQAGDSYKSRVWSPPVDSQADSVLMENIQHHYYPLQPSPWVVDLQGSHQD